MAYQAPIYTQLFSSSPPTPLFSLLFFSSEHWGAQVFGSVNAGQVANPCVERTRRRSFGQLCGRQGLLSGAFSLGSTRRHRLLLSGRGAHENKLWRRQRRWPPSTTIAVRAISVPRLIHDILELLLSESWRFFDQCSLVRRHRWRYCCCRSWGSMGEGSKGGVSSTGGWHRRRPSYANSGGRFERTHGAPGGYLPHMRAILHAVDSTPLEGQDVRKE